MCKAHLRENTGKNSRQTRPFATMIYYGHLHFSYSDEKYFYLIHRYISGKEYGGKIHPPFRNPLISETG